MKYKPKTKLIHYPWKNKQITNYKNATLTLYKLRTHFINKHPAFTGGIYDESGNYVGSAASKLYFHDEPPKICPPSIKPIKGKSLYLGVMNRSYGHFLLETLSRVWAVGDAEKWDNFVFHNYHPVDCEHIKIGLNCFGVSEDKIILIEETKKFEDLWVPNVQCELNVWMDSEQLKIFQRIYKCCKLRGAAWNSYIPASKGNLPIKDPLRLYLSRRKWSARKRISNEDEVEKVFESFGFIVINPEKINFRAAVTIFRRTNVMAGIWGSAVHNSVFMKPGGGTKVISLGFPKAQSPNCNQVMCDSLVGAESCFIKFKGEESKMDIDYLRKELESILPNQK